MLLRQFLVESLSLALMGGVLGLLIAHFGIRILFAMSPGSVPRATEIGIDGSVLLFSFAVSILTGILFGLAPMMHVTTKSLGLSLKDGGQRTTATSGRQLLRRILVVSEIAAAVMAVVVCGLLLRSFWNQTPNRLVMLHSQFPTMGFDKFWVSAPEYREFREWNQSFTEVAIYNVGLSSLQANEPAHPGLERASDGRVF